MLKKLTYNVGYFFVRKCDKIYVYCDREENMYCSNY